MICSHENFQGPGNFQGPELLAAPGIFQGAWKFPGPGNFQAPWKIPGSWIFPGPLEKSRGVLISGQTRCESASTPSDHPLNFEDLPLWTRTRQSDVDKSLRQQSPSSCYQFQSNSIISYSVNQDGINLDKGIDMYARNIARF